MPTTERGGPLPPAMGLAAHAAYACRHSGVCCTSGWEIPVEDALHAQLGAALDRGELQARGTPALVLRHGLPGGYQSVLGRRQGQCVFHAPGPDGCGLHAWGGPAAKPIACQQFPWMAVHDPRGTFVSLSHVCPSAADRLRDPADLVLAPMPRPAPTFDGLDVRRSLPPAMDARRLLDWDALSAWETQALDACARADAAEHVLDDLIAVRRHARRWTPGNGPLARWIASWTPAASAAVPSWAHDAMLDGLVRAAVPPGLQAPPPATGSRDPSGRSPLIRRYLAARLIACWPLHYGTGLATAIAYVAALLTVLAGELARGGAGTVDDAAVLAAVSETDRLVVHLAAPEALARGLDAWADRHLDSHL